MVRIGYLFHKFCCRVENTRTKLIYLETAFIYVKMNIFSKYGGTRFPNFCIGIHFLCLFPRSITNTFGVFFRYYKKYFRVIMLRYLINFEYYTANVFIV